jgi:hypothetical protein
LGGLVGGNRASHILLVIIHALDDLGDSIYARWFGDEFHKGSVTYVHSMKSNALIHSEGGQVEPMYGRSPVLNIALPQANSVF